MFRYHNYLTAGFLVLYIYIYIHVFLFNPMCGTLVLFGELKFLVNYIESPFVYNHAYCL